MHLLPYDYFADRPITDRGLSLLAEVIETARAEVESALLFDNGDLLQGNPMGDYLATRHAADPALENPMIAAMNLLRYDAATVGNHDFNHGLAYLRDASDQATFPFVLSNVITQRGPSPERDSLLYDPYVILPQSVRLGDGRKATVNVGVIGFVPPQITVWDFRHLVGQVITRDILDSAQTWVPRMRQAGADLIVALCHSGIGPDSTQKGMENAATALAGIPGIDVVLAGHTHQQFPGHDIEPGPNVDPAAGRLHGKPAVMAGFWGGHLGVIDLLLEQTKTGWHTVDSQASLRPVANRAADSPQGQATRARIETATAPIHRETLAYIRRPVGLTTVGLNTYFARVCPSAAVSLVAEAQRWYMRARLSGTRYADLPLLSAAAPFKAGGRGGPDFYTDVPEGELSIRNISDLYSYPNTIQAVRVLGRDLRDWLERTAAQFLQITPGKDDQPLINPAFPSYNFDMIQGVGYQIDPSAPARFDAAGQMINPQARRIRALHHFGAPIADDDVFIVATNSYRATGGGGFPGAKVENVVYEAPDMVRDVLLQFIADRGGVQHIPAGNWYFARHARTSALFESAPAAAGDIPALPKGRIEHIGPGQNGFDQFRLYF